MGPIRHVLKLPRAGCAGHWPKLQHTGPHLPIFSLIISAACTLENGVVRRLDGSHSAAVCWTMMPKKRISRSALIAPAMPRNIQSSVR